MKTTQVINTQSMEIYESSTIFCDSIAIRLIVVHYMLDSYTLVFVNIYIPEDCPLSNIAILKQCWEDPHMLQRKHSDFRAQGPSSSKDNISKLLVYDNNIATKYVIVMKIDTNNNMV